MADDAINKEVKEAEEKAKAAEAAAEEARKEAERIAAKAKEEAESKKKAEEEAKKAEEEKKAADKKVEEAKKAAEEEANKAEEAKKAEEEAKKAAEAKAAAAAAAAAAQKEQEAAAAKEAKKNEKKAQIEKLKAQCPPQYKPVGTSTFFWLGILCHIPVLGVLITVILSIFPKNRNIKSFARSIFAYYLIIFIACLIITLVAGAVIPEENQIEIGNALIKILRALGFMI